MLLEISIGPNSLQHMPILWVGGNPFFKKVCHTLHSL
jgi:hypothetical protein